MKTTLLYAVLLTVILGSSLWLNVVLIRKNHEQSLDIAAQDRILMEWIERTILAERINP